MNPYLPGNLPACKFDAAAVAAACEAVLVVSAAAGSSATSYQMQSHSDLVVHRESLMSLLFYCSQKSQGSPGQQHQETCMAYERYH